jgi:type III secretion system YscQ/HrcQ family protein
VSASVLPFPWHQVPAFSKADLELERGAKQALEGQVDLQSLRPILSQLFMAELTNAGVQRARVTSERRPLGCQFLLRGSGLVIFLSLEPALVALLVRRVLGQPPRIDDGAVMGPATTGAALAILAEIARRASRGAPLTPDLPLGRDGRPTSLAVGAQQAWAVDFWMRLDNTSYAGFAAITAEKSAPSAPKLSPEPRTALPITLPLLVARCVLSVDDYGSLCVGDVVVPDESNALDWLKAVLGGAPIAEKVGALLCSPGATRALVLSARGGKLCLAGETNMSYDGPVASKQAAGSESRQGSQDAPAADVVMDAPVVVHLELGGVTLSAQSWLGLRVGDVVCSDLPVGRPVTLRVADRAVAEGELVSVDGQVGVRIQRFFGA